MGAGLQARDSPPQMPLKGSLAGFQQRERGRHRAGNKKAPEGALEGFAGFKG